MAEQTSDSKPRGGIGRNEALRLSVTVAMVGLWVADLLVHHSHVEKVLGFVLIAALAPITVIDIEERRIPDRITVPASVAALVIGLVMHASGVPAQVLYGLATGVFLFIFALASRGGFGMGDVKLGVVLGLFLGRYVVVAVFAGVIASAIFSIGVLAARGLSTGLKTKIPMGPFLALGGVVAVLAGPRFF